MAELVAALLFNGGDECWRAWTKLAKDAVCFMATYVHVYADMDTGVAGGRSHEANKQIDRNLFQQAWELLASKTETTVETALEAVGLHRTNRTAFLEDIAVGTPAGF